MATDVAPEPALTRPRRCRRSSTATSRAAEAQAVRAHAAACPQCTRVDRRAAAHGRGGARARAPGAAADAVAAVEGALARRERPWWLSLAACSAAARWPARSAVSVVGAGARLLADAPARPAPAVAAGAPSRRSAVRRPAAQRGRGRVRQRRRRLRAVDREAARRCSRARSRAGARPSAPAARSGWPGSTRRSRLARARPPHARATASATSSCSPPTSRRSPSWPRPSIAAATLRRRRAAR